MLLVMLFLAILALAVALAIFAYYAVRCLVVDATAVQRDNHAANATIWLKVLLCSSLPVLALCFFVFGEMRSRGSRG